MIFLFFFGSQSIPPLSQDLANGAVVLIRVPLVNESAVALAEDHEGIHGPPDVILLPLCLKKVGTEQSLTLDVYFLGRSVFL